MKSFPIIDGAEGHFPKNKFDTAFGIEKIDRFRLEIEG